MTNADRRRLLDQFRASGMEGSILDVYKAYEQGGISLAEHRAQQQGEQPLRAETRRAKEGLRPYHQAGETERPWKSYRTRGSHMGRKALTDIEKVDKNGHIVESYKSVSPGTADTHGPYEGDIAITSTVSEGGDAGDKEERRRKLRSLEQHLNTKRTDQLIDGVDYQASKKTGNTYPRLTDGTDANLLVQKL